MIYLDTHVVIWLFAGELNRFPENVKTTLKQEAIFASPIVALELNYLHEIKRISVRGSDIIEDLHYRIGLSICEKPLYQVMLESSKQTWTRDPFDRIIVGHAAIEQKRLITKDDTILLNYPQAYWR